MKKTKEQLNTSFNVGDKVIFDKKKAVVLWRSLKFVDIEIIGTKSIIQGVHITKLSHR